jgi:hypothetical protein
MASGQPDPRIDLAVADQAFYAGDHTARWAIARGPISALGEDRSNLDYFLERQRQGDVR